MPVQKKFTRSDRGSVGRDRIVSGGDGSVVVGGNVNHSTIVAGDNSRINSASKFITIYKQVEERSNLSSTDKADLKSELQTFEDEDKKGPESNEGFLAQRLRNVRRIAPDILEVAIATIANPAAGFGTIAKKVAEKMKLETAQAASK
jgi:hypothetical protein